MQFSTLAITHLRSINIIIKFNASVWFVAVCTALKSGLKQHNHGYTRFGHCPARPTYPLCSDEERVSYFGESDHLSSKKWF